MNPLVNDIMKDWKTFVEINSTLFQLGKKETIVEENIFSNITHQLVDVSPYSSKYSLAQSCVITKTPVKTRLSVETIIVSPNAVVQLIIEEIPQIKVFYNPEHKSLLKNRKKKRNIADT